LSFAVNAINRSMGLPDLYPFHLSDAIVAKLDYVHNLVARTREAARTQAPKAEGAAVAA